MKFRFLILFIVFSSNTWAQCCCGEFYFRIYDKILNCICPSLNDTIKFQTYIPIEKTVLNCSLTLKCIKTEGNAGTAPLYLYKNNYYPHALFKFETGCNTSLKKILVTKSKESMIINFVDLPSETIILMDSIPFISGEVTYNVSEIIKLNKIDSYEMSPENKFYLHYLINTKSYSNSYTDSINFNFQVKNFPYANGVIRFNGQPTVNRDTSFYYFDYENKKLFCKGRLERYKTKCRKLSFESKQFIDNKKDYYKSACTKLYKIGNWIFYEENGNILLNCNYNKHNRVTVPHGVWKYYKDNKIYKIEKYNIGKLQLTSFDPKDF